MVDVATKVCVVLLGLLLVAFIWWVVSSANRERRRTRAEADAFPIPAPRDGKHHLGRHIDDGDVLTVPMLLARIEEINPPLVRPYMQDDMPTREIRVLGNDPPSVWTAPAASPPSAWFRETPPQ